MQLKKTCLAVVAALALAACGGGDDGPGYTRLVSFGDSLSDVGSYRTDGIKLASDGKGGKYTVNGAGNEIWIEQLSLNLGLPAPCPALTGLDATGDFAPLAAPRVEDGECTAYGQGGSRVTNAVGPWNAALLTLGDPRGFLGQLTVPVATQIENHLRLHGGSFTSTELVTVLAGANDVFVNTEQVALGLISPDVAVTAMVTAGAELATLVKTQIVGKGAKHVVVLNLPNIGRTPETVGAEAVAPGSQQLVDQMTKAFNSTLKAQLDGTAEVAQVDFYTENTAHFETPAAFGLSKTGTPACVNTFPGAPKFLAPSLTCTTATTLPDTDVSRYLFADNVHPTPYGHSLIRDMVLQALEDKGWD